MSLHSERSDAVLHILNHFNELRSIAHKRLTTTVEEDNSARVFLRSSCIATLCDSVQCVVWPQWFRLVAGATTAALHPAGHAQHTQLHTTMMTTGTF